jgi:hypothetical protein
LLNKKKRIQIMSNNNLTFLSRQEFKNLYGERIYGITRHAPNSNPNPNRLGVWVWYNEFGFGFEFGFEFGY